MANAIFADTIQGISDALEPLGFAVFLAQSRYDDVREEKMLSALLSRRPEALIMVGSPATAAGAAVARHFVAAGRQRLGFVGGDEPRATRRWQGFHDTALAAGLAPPRRLIHARNAGAGVAAADEMRDRDAVFVANDALAIGLLSGLRRIGRRVPDDVAVVGLGDLETGRMISPSLSTVRIDGEAIGRTAGGLTVSREGPRRVDLGFELLTRETG